MIDTALAAANDIKITMPIFVHGYDYPWPDGRGVITFLHWGVGPWFDPTLNKKNYPNRNDADLLVRREILKPFVRAVNSLLDDIAGEYPGQVFYVDLTNTLQRHDQWANELHPTNDGFAALAVGLDKSLQIHIH